MGVADDVEVGVEPEHYCSCSFDYWYSLFVEMVVLERHSQIALTILENFTK